MEWNDTAQSPLETTRRETTPSSSSSPVIEAAIALSTTEGTHALSTLGPRPSASFEITWRHHKLPTSIQVSVTMNSIPVNAHAYAASAACFARMRAGESVRPQLSGTATDDSSATASPHAPEIRARHTERRSDGSAAPPATKRRRHTLPRRATRLTTVENSRARHAGMIVRRRHPRRNRRRRHAATRRDPRAPPRRTRA